jgi:hypothetical protein
MMRGRPCVCARTLTCAPAGWQGSIGAARTTAGSGTAVSVAGTMVRKPVGRQ